MDMNMGQHPLPPSVQRQYHARLALIRFLRCMQECLLSGVKEQQEALFLVGHQEPIQCVGYGKDGMVILAR